MLCLIPLKLQMNGNQLSVVSIHTCAHTHRCAYCTEWALYNPKQGFKNFSDHNKAHSALK